MHSVPNSCSFSIQTHSSSLISRARSPTPRAASTRPRGSKEKKGKWLNTSTIISPLNNANGRFVLVLDAFLISHFAGEVTYTAGGKHAPSWLERIEKKRKMAEYKHYNKPLKQLKRPLCSCFRCVSHFSFCGRGDLHRGRQARALVARQEQQLARAAAAPRDAQLVVAARAATLLTGHYYFQIHLVSNMYVFVYASLSLYIDIDIDMDIDIDRQIDMHIYTHTCVCIYLYIYICIYIYIYMYMYICIYRVNPAAAPRDAQLVVATRTDALLTGATMHNYINKQIYSFIYLHIYRCIYRFIYMHAIIYIYINSSSPLAQTLFSQVSL